MPLTKQQAFDKALAHLRQQGCKASNGTDCLYRGDNNVKCAIGALIPDELYDAEMEGVPVGLVLAQWPRLQDILDPLDTQFYRELQGRMHDSLHPKTWTTFRDALEASALGIAQQYNLEYTPPQRPEGTV